MTDPTITIAGLTAERDALILSLRASIDYGATSEEVRLIAAAELASAKAERDALAAQLAEVRARLDAAPRSIELAELQAAHEKVLASERAHLAACQTRIAGLEQAADERSKEVARLTAQLEEARGALVDIADDLHVSTIGVTSTDVATRCGVAVSRLTARVAELEARPVLTAQSLCDALVHARAAGDFLHVPAAVAADVANRIVTGGSVTLPAQDRAEELTDAIESRLAAIGFSGFGGRISYTDRIRIVEESLASLGAPPTSPPEVFAGVSEENLANTAATAHRECRDHNPWMAVARAVLARLEVTLVAPVDPEQIAADITGPIGDRVRTGEWKRIKDAARTALTAAGIPVTPERGK